MTSPTDAAGAALAVGVKAATAYGRNEVAARLTEVLRRVRDPATRAFVVGEFKQGKSALVNALVNADVCVVDADVATARPTRLGYSTHPCAAWVERAGDGTVSRESLPLAQVGQRMTEAPTGEGGSDARARGWSTIVEVGLPRRILADGLELIDTPGMGGLTSIDGASALIALTDADVLLFVTDASQELTGSEVEFLRKARDAGPSLAVVVTKIDVAARWREIVDLDRKRLRTEGLAASVFPVSSRIRGRALVGGDALLNEESGFGSLVHWIREQVTDRRSRAVRMAGRELSGAVVRLGEPLAAERAALTDPASAGGVMGSLREAEERYAGLRADSAGWQQLLMDGAADLSSDIDFGLRELLRSIGSEADEMIDGGDPAETWPQIESWLNRRVGEAVVRNHAELVTRATELAERVEASFAEAERELTGALDLPDEITMPAAFATTAAVELEREGHFASGLTAMRGLQGGVIMLTMFGGLLGLTVAAPVVVGVGALLGGRAVRDERRRQLTVRRQRARSAVRTYLDEVSFHVGKETRDVLRLTQRSLRDALAGRAGELARSASDALDAARRSVELDRPKREERLADVDAELRRLEALAQLARRLESGVDGR